LPGIIRAKTFLLKGGEFSLAFTKEQKQKMLAQYEEWLSKSQAVIMLQYTKIATKDVDALRVKVQDVGGEMHITKNTLLKIALKNKGIVLQGDIEGTTMCGFAFNDAPGLAKVFTDAAKGSEILKVKGGVMENEVLTAKQVAILAETPPLPVMRATLLGLILAPASKLVRTLAEPARQVAAVVKAYSEQSTAQAQG
jgi:large subunit ribosomal protein L10